MEGFRVIQSLTRKSATAQPRNSAGNPFAGNQVPSVAAGLHTMTTRSHSIIAVSRAMTARAPSAIPWLHSTTEGVHATAEGGHAVIAWVHSAAAWLHSMIAWLPSVIARGQSIIDSIPDYTDTAAMPPAGQSALWKYKGIYIQADQRVGQWSDVVSIPVAG